MLAAKQAKEYHLLLAILAPMLTAIGILACALGGFTLVLHDCNTAVSTHPFDAKIDIKVKRTFAKIFIGGWVMACIGCSLFLLK